MPYSTDVWSPGLQAELVRAWQPLTGPVKLTVRGVGIAVPAQPADFQATAESDSRIQLSWLLPPQERIIKYELVYWAAEDEGQQVSHKTRVEGGVPA